jgi:ribonuclease Z
MKLILFTITFFLAAALPLLAQSEQRQFRAGTGNGEVTQSEIQGQAKSRIESRLESPIEIRVILLGTGGPELSPYRAGYATLIEAGGLRLLFDAGRGVLQRIYESRIDPVSIDAVFLTHLHSDHIEGLPGIWITPWYLLGRTEPLSIRGPEGTLDMIAGMKAMYGHDMQNRANRWNRREDLEPIVAEIPAGDIYLRHGVGVTAFAVSHGDGNPAFGYRITYRGKNVVLSGDTTYSDNVVKYGRNANVIVHNVIALGDAYAATPLQEVATILVKLTTPEQAARIFKEAAPGMAVYSHIVKKALPGLAGDEAIMKRTRNAGYSGPLTMGQDRMVIDIGADDSVHVLQPEATANLPDVDFKPGPAGSARRGTLWHPA